MMGKHKSGLGRRHWIGALAAVTSLAGLAACGSKSSNTSTPTSAATTGASTGTSRPAALTGSRSGQVINLEVVSNTEGAEPLPLYQEGVVADAQWINDHGGVHGAKIHLSICATDGTPEGSINCANQAVDNHVVAMVQASDDAVDSSLPVLSKAGIPLVINTPGGTKAKTDPDVTVLTASQSAQLVGPFQFFAKGGAKKVGIVLDDIPVSRAIAPAVTLVAKGLGLQPNFVYVDETNPNWDSVVLSLKSAHDDAVQAFLGDAGCTSFVSAETSLNFKGIVNVGTCAQFIQALGSKAVGVYTYGSVWPYAAQDGAPAVVKTDLGIYGSAMKAAGFNKDVGSSFAVTAFQAFWNFNQVLLRIPVGTPITSTSINAGLHAAKFIGFNGTIVDCTGPNKVPSETTACTSSIVVTRVEASPSGPVLKSVSGEYDVSVGVHKILGS